MIQFRTQQQADDYDDYMCESGREKMLDAIGVTSFENKEKMTHSQIVNFAYGFNFAVTASKSLHTLEVWTRNDTLDSKWSWIGDGYYVRRKMRFSAIVGTKCMGTIVHTNQTSAMHRLTDQMDIPYFVLWSENGYQIDIVG